MIFSEDELDTYPAIYEQDVDLVIVMALRASGRVRALFLEASGLVDEKLIQVRHSVSTLGGREADIEAHFGDPANPLIVQIEDKIDARFTDKQPNAYADRAATMAASDTFAGAYAVLCAPQGYLDGAPAERDFFDHCVSHESLRDALLEEGAWGRELALIVEHAIVQHRRSSGVAPTDAELISQLRKFAARAADVALPIPTIGNRSGSTQIWVGKEALRPIVGTAAYLRLVPDRGVVDIELYGLRPRFDADSFRAADPNDLEWQLSRNNVYVWLEPPGPNLDLKQPLETQATDVADLWLRAGRLRDWWESQGADTISRFVRDS